MRHEGYNGWIEIDGDSLVIAHEGLAAKVGGLAKQGPRRIPLRSVTAVVLKPASMFGQGWITLGLDGQPVAQLGAGTAGSDPNTLLFRHKDRDAFSALYDWLENVATLNGGGTPTRPTGLAPVVDKPEKLGRRERAALRDDFQTLTLAAARGDAEALARLPAALTETRPHWKDSQLEDVLWQAMAAAVEYVAQDDALSVDEESHLAALVDALGLEWMELRDRNPAAFETLVIARINDGRPPTLDPSKASIITKRGEVVYGTFLVELMKEVVHRELRGGSAGVSIPLGLGLRFRTGAVRGRSVVVGTSLQVADRGEFVVTSTRTVFSGARKTLEFRYDKLVDMQQFSDGLRLNVSNRQAASLFRFVPGSSPMIAAGLISHAVSISP